MLEQKQSWNVVEKLETHREERQMEENSLHNQHNIVNFLLEVSLSNTDSTSSMITACQADRHPAQSNSSRCHQVTSILCCRHQFLPVIRANDVLDVNAFEIRGIEDSQRGLYPLTALMNASCSPNTQNSIDSDWMCRVRAVRKISKGEEITDTYVSTMANTLYRRRQLKALKYFDCDCKRCADPTELGSHFSTLLCRIKSCGGFLLCRDPLLSSSPWACLKCGAEMDGEQVRREQEQWEERVEAAPRLIPDQEKLLAALKLLFHPNHNLCMDVMFNLAPLYGVRGSKAEDLVSEAEKKEKMCGALLSSMEKVIPGGFRMRGMLLVERHTSKLFLLRTQLETKQCSKSSFVRNVASLRAPLAEAVKILSLEPPGSLESARLVQAEKYLAQVDSIVENAGKTLLPASAE